MRAADGDGVLGELRAVADLARRVEHVEIDDAWSSRRFASSSAVRRATFAAAARRIPSSSCFCRVFSSSIASVFSRSTAARGWCTRPSRRSRG